MSEVVPGVMILCGEEGHHFGSRVRGGEPLAVRICTLCGEIDWADLREQHEATATARAERAEAAIQRVRALDENNPSVPVPAADPVWQQGWGWGWRYAIQAVGRALDSTETVEAAPKGQIGPVLAAIRAWYGNLPDDEGLMAAWEAYCAQTRQCYTCDRLRCPECKLCPVCADDGHAEGCSRGAQVIEEKPYRCRDAQLGQYPCCGKCHDMEELIADGDGPDSQVRVDGSAPGWLGANVLPAVDRHHSAQRPEERSEEATKKPSEEERQCPRCGSARWVSVSLNEGWPRIAQCVPCGAYHPGVLGPGWRAQAAPVDGEERK